MQPIKKFFAANIFLILLLIFGAVVLAWQVDKPFWGHHDWNGVYWGAVARNYLRYGPAETKLAMVTNGGQAKQADFNYNFHYPPLFALMLAGFEGIFGVNETAARSFALLFSLGSAGVFFLLVRKYFGLVTAGAAALFWMTTPMFIYFGKMPVHEIPLMFFVLLAMYFYLEGYFWRTLAAATAAMLLTWPGFFLVPAITAHGIIKGGRESRGGLGGRELALLWLIPAVIFALHLVHNFLVNGSLVGGGLKEVFLLRTGGVAIVPYLATLARWAWTYYFLLLPLAGMGMAWAWRRGQKRGDILFLFLVFALLYPLIFRDASFRHDYLLIYFWPFLALGAALALKVLPRVAFVAAAGVVVLTQLFTRWPFILALQESSLYRESVRVGMAIGKETQPKDKILLISQDPTVPFDAWFVSFYADRAAAVTYAGEDIAGGYDQVFVYLPGGRIERRVSLQ